MRTSTLLSGVLVTAAALAVGCDRTEPTAAPAAETTGTTSTNTSPAATGNTGNATLDGAMGQARDAAAGVTAAANNQAAAMGDNAAAAGNTLQTEAQSLFDRAQAAISSANFDEAGKYVEQLKGMRDRLPPEWQTRVDELAKTFTDAKAKLGTALPAGVMPR